MYVRRTLLLLAVTAVAVGALPSTCSAQLFGRRGMYGGGYGNYGYGNYGSGYYGGGRGLSIGMGTGYGYGYGYPYGGYGYGSPYGSFGYGSTYRGNGYATGGYYNSVPGVAYGQPSSGTSSYQSFYPSGTYSAGTYNSAGCGCGSGTGAVAGAPNMAMNGRGSIVVNAPANADISWNGTHSNSYGPVRYFSTLPLNNGGASQKFEARWTGADGKTVTQTREVQARPNETVNVDFNQPENANGTADAGNNPSNPPSTNAIPTGERKDAR